MILKVFILEDLDSPFFVLFKKNEYLIYSTLSSLEIFLVLPPIYATLLDSSDSVNVFFFSFLDFVFYFHLLKF